MSFAQGAYVVHPTFWLKAVAWFLKNFVSEKFFSRVRYCASLPELYRLIARNQVGGGGGDDVIG